MVVHGRHRLRRVAGFAGKALLGVCVAALALVAFAFFFLNTSAGKRLAATQVNGALDGLFAGTLRLETFEHLDLRGIEHAHLRLLAADGRPLLDIRDATVDLNALTLAWAALFGRGALPIHLERLHVSDAVVLLEQDAAGNFGLVGAFEPKHKAPEPAAPGPGVAVVIDEIVLDHVWIHGHLTALPVLDAELYRARGAFRYDESGTKLALASAHAETRALPHALNPRGDLTASLSVPNAPQAPLQAEARYRGEVGSVATSLHASIQGERVKAELVVPRAEPGRVRQLVPGLELREPVSARVTADGTLSRLHAIARIGVGKGSATAEADTELKPSLKVNGTLRLSHIDARAFSASAPTTDFTAHATVSAHQRPSSTLSGSYVLYTESARVLEYRVPALYLTGNFSDSGGTLALKSREAPFDAELSVTLLQAAASRSPGAAEFSVAVSAPELGTLAPSKSARGRAELHAKGRYDFRDGALESAGQLVLSNAGFGANELRHASLAARVSGERSALSVQAAAELQDATLGGERIAHAKAQATGPLLAPHVQADVSAADGLRLQARANLAQGSFLIRDLDAKVSRGDTTLRARARRIHLDGARVDFTDVRLSGVGDAALSGSVARRRVQLSLRVQNLDLHRLELLAGRSALFRSGALSLDADVRGPLDALHGTVQGSVRSLSVGNLSSASADVNVELDGRRMNGQLEASVDGAGHVRVNASELRLPAGGLSSRTLRQATGDVRLDTELDLAPLVAALPEETRPVDKAAGKLALHGHIVHRSPGEWPDLELTGQTRGLEIVGKGSPAPIRDRAQAKQAKPLNLKQVDARFRMALKGATGQTDVLAQLYDAQGMLLDVSAKSSLPRALFTAEGDGLTALIETLPVEAHVNVPHRELARMPTALRPAGVLGSVEASLDARGSAAEPAIEVRAKGSRLRSKDPSFPTPIDLTVEARYASDRSRITVDALRDGHPALSARSEIDGNVPELLRKRARAPALLASAAVKLDRFPLVLVPILKERQIHGDLSGEIRLDDLGRDAALRARARVERLELGNVHCQTATLSVDAGSGQIAGNFQLSHGDGSLSAELRSGLDWGSELAPKLDDSTPTHARLLAKDFRVGTLQPFVAEQVSHLDGRLTANLESRSDGGTTTVEGQARLSQGSLQVPAIGQEFHGIRARLVASSGGVFKVEDVVARGRQGRVRAAAAGRLDGLTLRTARARLAIAEREKLPLTTQGVEIGDGWGAVDVTLLTSSDRKTTVINFDAPSFHLDLPETKQRSLQRLEDAPNIRVGARIDPKDFHALPLQPLEDPPEPTDSRTILNVALGKDVWVRQGTSVRARLGGKLRIELGNEMVIAGTITLPGGQLDVQGKRFELEHGTVTFQGDDPTNPVVLATARYDSPDNYRVYAEFVGPVKTGKLKLHSEPPLSEDEILSLLLFGSPDGSLGSGAGEGNPAATAVGVGGGTATQGLNAALADLTNLDVSTRVDTSRGSPTPELVIQLTRRLSAQVGYNLGTPSLGQAPDRTFITLDLRLKRRWSLDTTVGDHGGTMLDAIWRHRY